MADKEYTVIFSYENKLIHKLFSQFSSQAVDLEVQLGPHAFMAWG